MLDKPPFGYTLPVYATAGACAALRWLQQDLSQGLGSGVGNAVLIDLIEPAQTVEIPIEQVAGLDGGMALAIARSNPGDNLDITRNTPVWALVKLATTEASKSERITIYGGEGIGRIVNANDQPAIYAYAQRLLRQNLEPLLKPFQTIEVTIILPEGRQLATRTSNEAFGVVEGLSLLGTTGISQPLSTPSQLDAALKELREKARKLAIEAGEQSKRGVGADNSSKIPAKTDNLIKPAPVDEPKRISNYQLPMTNDPSPTLVFCIGENGLDLTRQMGIDSAKVIKTANWLGPLLVEAGIQQVGAILLFGYHGKLIKLAGGIFHTHHHLADGRQEILTAHCAAVGMPTPFVQQVLNSATAEDVLKSLRELDASNCGNNWVEQVYGALAHAIDQRARAYIRTWSEQDVLVGSVLFDRSRQIIVKSAIGSTLLSQLC